MLTLLNFCIVVVQSRGSCLVSFSVVRVVIIMFWVVVLLWLVELLRVSGLFVIMFGME